MAVAVIAWLLRTSIDASDPYMYVNTALAFPTTHWVPLGYTRYGMILPLLPVVAVFGNSEMTYYFWPLVSSGLLGACLYLLGQRFCGPTAGVVAAILAFASPLVLLNLLLGYPDIQSTAVFGLAVVLSFVIRDLRATGASAPIALLLAVGFCLGWAFEARETSCLTWPVVAIVLWSQGRELRRTLIFVLLGLASWAAADVAIGYFAYGDPLIRVHAFTQQDLATATQATDQRARVELVGRDRWFYATAVPRYLSGSINGVWHLWIMGVALLGLIFRRSRFAAVWFLMAYVGFVAVAGGLSPHHPAGRIDLARYWIPFIAVAGLAAAQTTAEVAARAAHRLAGRRFGSVTLLPRGVLVLLVVLVAGGPMLNTAVATASNPAYAINGSTQLSQLRDFLGRTTSGRITVWSDLATARMLPVYQRSFFGNRMVWQGPVRTLSPTTKPLSGDYVVINSPTSDSCKQCRAWFATYLADGGEIDPSWYEVWRTPQQNLILYRVS